MKVAIIFGSKSDTDVMRGAANCLREFGIEFEAHILSAHRVPESPTLSRSWWSASISDRSARS